MVIDEYSKRYFIDFVRSKNEAKERIINTVERRENETVRK